MNPIIGFFSLLFAAIGAIIFSGGPLGTVGTAVGGVIGFFSLPLAFIFAKVFFWRGINKIRQIRNQLKKPTGFFNNISNDDVVELVPLFL